MNAKAKSKVAVYVRVSTLDQEKGIASQEDACTRYLEGHSLSSAHWFRDRLSGKDTDRPQFKRLQKAIFEGSVDTVICWKLDRLSRSLQDGVNLLCDWCKRGVRVIAVSQQLDFSGTTGQMIASVLFAVAEMERENLRENTKRGLAAARARGVKLGRRPTLQAEPIAEMIERGMSVSEVARTVKATRQGIYRCLERAGMDVETLRQKQVST